MEIFQDRQALSDPWIESIRQETEEPIDKSDSEDEDLLDSEDEDLLDSEDEDTVRFFHRLCPETDDTEESVNEDMSLAELSFLERQIANSKSQDAPKPIEQIPSDLTFEDQLAVLNVQPDFLQSLTSEYRRRVVSRLVAFVVENDANDDWKSLNLSNCFLRTSHVDSILDWLYAMNFQDDVETLDLSNNNLDLLPTYGLLNRCRNLYRLYLQDNLFQGSLYENLKRDKFVYRRRITVLYHDENLYSHYGNPNVLDKAF